MPLIASPDASPETVGLLQSWKLPDGVTLAVETGAVDNDALLIERCGKADAILLNWAKVSKASIEACSNLKVISFLGIGAMASSISTRRRPAGSGSPMSRAMATAPLPSTR